MELSRLELLDFFRKHLFSSNEDDLAILESKSTDTLQKYYDEIHQKYQDLKHVKAAFRTCHSCQTRDWTKLLICGSSFDNIEAAPRYEQRHIPRRCGGNGGLYFLCPNCKDACGCHNAAHFDGYCSDYCEACGGSYCSRHQRGRSQTICSECTDVLEWGKRARALLNGQQPLSWEAFCNAMTRAEVKAKTKVETPTSVEQKTKTPVPPQSKRVIKRIHHKITAAENASCQRRSKSPQWLSVTYR